MISEKSGGAGPSGFMVLIHWRIKPDEESRKQFIDHWNTLNTVADRSGLSFEFLSGAIPAQAFPNTTWHLDSDSLGDHKSYVTVGLWRDEQAFLSAISGFFGDDLPMKPFEKYRRRRVVFDPYAWRIGQLPLPEVDSPGTM